MHCNLHNLNGKIYSTLNKSLLYPNKVRNYRRHEKLLRRAKIRSSNAAVTMSKTLASLECKTRCTNCFKNYAKMFGSRQHTRLKHIKDKNTQFQTWFSDFERPCQQELFLIQMSLYLMRKTTYRNTYFVFRAFSCMLYLVCGHHVPL